MFGPHASPASYDRTRRCQTALICSAVVLCALLIGCSSSGGSGDSTSAGLQEQLDMANDQVASLRAQIEELQGRADITPVDLASLHLQIEVLRGRANITPDEVARLRAQVETLRGRADITPDELTRLRTQIETLMGGTDSASEELARLRAQVEELGGRADITPDELARLRTQIETLMDGMDTTSEELVRLRAQAEELGGRADITPEELTSLRTQIEELSDRADITPEELTRLRTQIETLMGGTDATSEELARLRARITVLEGRADITPEALASLRTRVEELSGRADITPEALASLRARIAELEGRADGGMPPGDDDDMPMGLEAVLTAGGVRVEGTTGASREASDFSLADRDVTFKNEGWGIESFSSRVSAGFGGFSDEPGDASDTVETMGLWADGVAGFVILSGRVGAETIGVHTAYVGVPADAPTTTGRGRAFYIGRFTGVHKQEPGAAFDKTTETTPAAMTKKNGVVMGGVRLDVAFNEDGEATTLDATFDNFVARVSGHEHTFEDVPIGRRGGFARTVAHVTDTLSGNIAGQFHEAGDGENAAGMATLQNGTFDADGVAAEAFILGGDTPTTDVDDAANSHYLIEGIFIATE